MEKLFINFKNNTISLYKLFFAFIILLSFSIVFIFAGIDYAKVKCENANCFIYNIYFGFIVGESREIKEVTDVIFDVHKNERKKIETVNIILKNERNSIGIFNGYSGVNIAEKKEAYKDVQKFINGEIKVVDKIYGAVNVFFYVGLLFLFFAVKCFEVTFLIKIFPLKLIFDDTNKILYIKHRFKRQSIDYLNIVQTRLSDAYVGEKYKIKHPILSKINSKHNNFNILSLKLNKINKNKEIDIGGINYSKEDLLTAKNKIDNIIKKSKKVNL